MVVSENQLETLEIVDSVFKAKSKLQMRHRTEELKGLGWKARALPVPGVPKKEVDMLVCFVVTVTTYLA